MKSTKQFKADLLLTALYAIRQFLSRLPETGDANIKDGSIAISINGKTFTVSVKED